MESKDLIKLADWAQNKSLPKLIRVRLRIVR